MRPCRVSKKLRAFVRAVRVPVEMAAAAVLIDVLLLCLLARARKER